MHSKYSRDLRFVSARVPWVTKQIYIRDINGDLLISLAFVHWTRLIGQELKAHGTSVASIFSFTEKEMEQYELE